MSIQQHFPILLFTAGDHGPYTASPQDFLATEPEDIGQDIVFLTNPAQEEVSISVATAEEGEEQPRGHTANPAQQSPAQVQSPTLPYDKEPHLTEDLQSTAPPSEHVEKSSYPESSLAAPGESHTASPKTSAVLAVVDAATLPAANATPELRVSENETLDTMVYDVASVTEADELLGSSSDMYQENDLPVLQEDQTPADRRHRAPVTEPTHSGTSYVPSPEPEDERAATVEVESAATTFPQVEDVNSSPTEEESGDEDPQNVVTVALVGAETCAACDLVSTTGSGKAVQFKEALLWLAE